MFKQKKSVKFSTRQIGRVFEDDKAITYFEKNFRDNLNIDDFVLVNGNGVIYNGQAGPVKTHKLINMMLQTDNPLMLSFMNKAIENIKQRLRKRIQNDENIDIMIEEVNNICRTL